MLLTLDVVDLWVGVENRDGVSEMRLEGRLAGEAISELEALASKLERPIRIDLSQLLSADEAGLALLRARRKAGDELVGVRPLIQLGLEDPRQE